MLQCLSMFTTNITTASKSICASIFISCLQTGSVVILSVQARVRALGAEPHLLRCTYYSKQQFKFHVRKKDQDVNAPHLLVLRTSTVCCFWTFSWWGAPPPGRWWCHRDVASGRWVPRPPGWDPPRRLMTGPTAARTSSSGGPGTCRSESSLVETWELRGEVMRRLNTTSTTTIPYILSDTWFLWIVASTHFVKINNKWKTWGVIHPKHSTPTLTQIFIQYIEKIYIQKPHFFTFLLQNAIRTKHISFNRKIINSGAVTVSLLFYPVVTQSALKLNARTVITIQFESNQNWIGSYFCCPSAQPAGLHSGSWGFSLLHLCRRDPSHREPSASSPVDGVHKTFRQDQQPCCFHSSTNVRSAIKQKQSRWKTAAGKKVWRSCLGFSSTSFVFQTNILQILSK